MTLENLQAILEADSSVPVASQELFCNGKALINGTASLAALGVQDDDLILLRNKGTGGQGTSVGGGREASSGGAGPGSGSHEREAEALRQEMLSNAPLMAQLRATRPDLAEAVTSDPSRFIEMLRAERQRNAQSEREALQLAAADEFDIDAQRRIEEAIRQEQVMENFGSAMEFNPESFGRVTMLYVETQVNGHPIKAFVDSGAQATIMSPECAERCGIMRLLDRRFAGIARGVGTAKILGRVHSAQIKLGDDLFLPCSFTIMEGRTTELLFGLDMLKRHACLIDLAKNALTVHGRSIRFLDEHELPPSARGEGLDDEEEGQATAAESGGVAKHAIDAANANAAAAAGAGQSFPGRGSTLSTGGSDAASSAGQSFGGMSWNHPSSSSQGQPPASVTAPSSNPAAPAASAPGGQQQANAWPAASIQALKDLGASESQAKAFLDAAGGNIEVAASLLFQQ